MNHPKAAFKIHQSESCGEKLLSKRPLGCLYCQLPDLGREFALEAPFLWEADAERKSMALAAPLESFSSWELHAPLQGDKKQGLILSPS